MEVTCSGDIVSKVEFGNCPTHLEWQLRLESRTGQQRRVSDGSVEVQVLDGYENLTYADGLTGAIYGQYPPKVNACRQPGEWQTYDIVFEAPRYDGDNLTSPAYLTVFLNGILLHNRQPAHGPTGHQSLSSYNSPHGPSGPLKLQDHGDLVRFKNIWMRHIKSYDEA